MNIASYIQIDIIPVIILILLYVNSKVRFSNIRNARRFQLQTLLVITILLVDASIWYMNEAQGYVSIPLFWILNIIYFLLTEVISFCWFLYVFHQIYGETLTEKQIKGLRWGMLPLAVICIFIVLSPWTHAIFYVDTVHVQYHRGPLHLIQAAGGFGYILAASVLALYKYKKEALFVRRREYLFLALVAVFTFSVVGLFLLYSNFQQTQISMDDLTHLSNRGSFEQHLMRMSQQPSISWYLLFIDIDGFKQINDKYGHVEGDRALTIVADCLRHTIGTSNAFISRYGGDEFAVILEKETEAEIKQTISLLEAALAQSCKQNELSYPLLLSIGYAKYEKESMNTLDKLTDLADQRMYQQKQRNHSMYTM